MSLPQGQKQHIQTSSCLCRICGNQASLYPMAMPPIVIEITPTPLSAFSLLVEFSVMLDSGSSHQIPQFSTFLERLWSLVSTFRDSNHKETYQWGNHKRCDWIDHPPRALVCLTSYSYYLCRVVVKIFLKVDNREKVDIYRHVIMSRPSIKAGGEKVNIHIKSPDCLEE